MAKISFTGKCAAGEDRKQRNRNYSHRLGLPEVGSRPVADFLAVVGGSPSIEDDRIKQTLREWNGEVWAINGTFQWCLNKGIEATFYCVDPKVGPDLCEGATNAVLADCVAPSVFDSIQGEMELARIGPNGMLHGTTAASTAPVIAAHRGHRHVTIFGCESSFGETTHAYKNLDPNLIWVQCGGEEFVTSPQLIMQAEFLSELARELPNFITIDGDGFLGALVRHGDYNVTHICRATHNALMKDPAYANKFEART